MLEAIYTINKLAINRDKTELMIICRKRMQKYTNKTSMKASNYQVKQVKQVKILGYIIQSNLKNKVHINKIISNLTNRIHNIKRLGNKTLTKMRKSLVKALVIGKLNYTLPLLINCTQRQLERLNTIINRACKVITHV